MDPHLRKLVELQLKYEKIDSLYEELFPEQKRFVKDPSKFKAALCSRRAGKTRSCAHYLLGAALEHPGTRSTYISLTRRNAKDIIWRTLNKINIEKELGFQPHETDLRLYKDDGTEIALFGANTENLAEHFRGIAVPLVVIDEAASFRHHLKYLIDEVIVPTLLDHDGSLALIGTPSASCLGPFYEATTQGKEFSVHKWTVLQNPYIPHAAKWLENYRSQKGWSEDHPIYQREWLGRWVKSEDSLVFKVRIHNIVSECLFKNPNYIFGIDLGYEDSNAICVLAFDYDQPDVYVVDEFKKNGQTISEFAEILRHYAAKYQPIVMVADTGGLGKAIVAELNQRFQFQIKPAEKAHKFSNIEILNGDLISGRVKFVESATQKLRLEMDALQWDADHPMKIDERSENHLCDAALYGFQASKHYTHEPKIEIFKTPADEVNEYWEQKEFELMKEKSGWD